MRTLWCCCYCTDRYGMSWCSAHLRRFGDWCQLRRGTGKNSWFRNVCSVRSTFYDPKDFTTDCNCDVTCAATIAVSLCCVYPQHLCFCRLLRQQEITSIQPSGYILNLTNGCCCCSFWPDKFKWLSICSSCTREIWRRSCSCSIRWIRINSFSIICRCWW